jgi:hypothetical protein
LLTAAAAAAAAAAVTAVAILYDYAAAAVAVVIRSSDYVLTLHYCFLLYMVVSAHTTLPST